MAQDDDDPSVGFGRPPTASRFRPGRSGNPSGRPKGSRNFLTDLRAELQSRTTITEQGRQLSVTKQVAIIKRLIAAAMDGEMRALTTLVNISTRSLTGDRQQGDADLSGEEAEIVDEFAHRERNPQAPPDPNPRSDSNDPQT